MANKHQKQTQEPKTYRLTWRNKWLTSQATTISEMAEQLRAAASHLENMADHGCVLDSADNMEDDYADLVTSDPEVAEMFSMIPDHWHCEDCGSEQPGEHLDGCSLTDLDE